MLGVVEAEVVVKVESVEGRRAEEAVGREVFEWSDKADNGDEENEASDGRWWW